MSRALGSKSHCPKEHPDPALGAGSARMCKSYVELHHRERPAVAVSQHLRRRGGAVCRVRTDHGIQLLRLGARLGHAANDLKKGRLNELMQIHARTTYEGLQIKFSRPTALDALPSRRPAPRTTLGRKRSGRTR